MYDIVLCVYERFRVDGLKRYVNDDRFRVDGDKNMRLLAFAFTVVFVWTGPKTPSRSQFITDKKHCVAGRLMLFWYFKKIPTKNILFYPFVFDIFDARLPSVIGA